MIEAIDYKSLKAPTPPWNDLGEVSQRELLFSFPVVRKQGGVPVENGIFVPYIFVDDQASAFTGREVVGLPKVLANFSLDRNFPASMPITIRFEERRASGPIRLVDLVKISPINRVAPPSLPMVLTPTSMVGFSTRILINPQSPATDSYQSIMRCIYASTPTATGLLPPAKVTLRPIVRLDIQSTLGIRPELLWKCCFTQSVLPGGRLLPRGRDDAVGILGAQRVGFSRAVSMTRRTLVSNASRRAMIAEGALNPRALG
jgi:hypothetical protein